MEIVNTLTGMVNIPTIFKWVFALEFAMVAIFGLTATIRLIVADREVRIHFAERLTVFDAFFITYQKTLDSLHEKKQEQIRKAEHLAKMRSGVLVGDDAEKTGEPFAGAVAEHEPSVSSEALM